jgi:hypothetical protein
VLDMADVSCYSPTVNLSWDFHFVDDGFGRWNKMGILDAIAWIL